MQRCIDLFRPAANMAPRSEKVDFFVLFTFYFYLFVK